MNTNGRYDVAVIGGGPGGTPAAMQLAGLGKKVLLVEASGKLGGACLFSGCIPSKIIRHSADEFFNSGGPTHETEREFKGAARVWAGTIQKMDRILSGRSSAAGRKTAEMKYLDFVAGTATFLSDREIEIRAFDGTLSRHVFDQAIVATGSVPVIPPLGGDALSEVMTSDSFFARRELPPSLVIIGGGPIGVELAQMLSRIGVRCTIIEMAGSILDKVCEPEFTPLIQEALERDGVDIYTSSIVTEINRTNDGFVTTFKDGSSMTRTIGSKQVLIAAGRAPNIKGLGLEAAGIRFSAAGIDVDDYLETTAEGIFAAGDVIAGPRFAHTATSEARVAAANIAAGKRKTIDFSINSWVLFTNPEMASAGLIEAAVAQGGRDVVTGIYDFAIDAAAQVEGIPEGQLKFVVDKGSREIIGIHVLAPHAGQLAGEAALIVAGRLTLSDVCHAIHPHPTWSESFGFLALNMLASLN